MLVFDIGSNALNFAEACMKQYGDDARLVLVEPNKEHFKPQYTHPPLSRAVIGVEYKAVGAVAEKDKAFNVNVQDGISSMSEDFMKRSRFCRGNRYIKEQTFQLYRDQLAATGRIWSDEQITRYILEVGKFESLESWSVANTMKDYSQVFVDVITLDMLVEKYGSPDLIKLDIEGHEHEALKGLTQKHGEITFEWSEETFDIAEKCMNKLVSLGYEEFGIVGFFEDGHPPQATPEEKGGDNYLRRPNQYYSAEVLIEAVKPYTNEDRRISWGMIWAK